MPIALRSVKQPFRASPEILEMMRIFRRMVNECITIGMQNDVATMKHLSNLSYKSLGRYDIVAYYKLCAISRAAGILANRKKSLKRGYPTRKPCAHRQMLISCYGFKVVNRVLKVPLGNKKYLDVPLNDYTNKILADKSVQVRSFTLTSDSLSICYAKEIKETRWPEAVIGVDRNLGNVTAGNHDKIVQYKVERLVRIGKDSRSAMRAFRRNDTRIGKKLAQKYGSRKRNRIHQLLHKVSKAIVSQAVEQRVAIVFEDITDIRRLYQRSNLQGRDYRAMMNSWPYYELKRQVTYKAAWHGVAIFQLSKADTRGTSKQCPRCGKRTQVAQRGDISHIREVWCESCKWWMDRDVAAAMNIASRGLQRFCSPQGLAGEAMKGNLERDPAILRVDASKLTHRQAPAS
jgi:putative transposase